jgi:hypothetical protein
MEWLDQILSMFNKTDVPFTLLFVALFFYTIRNNTSREHHLNNLIDQRLEGIQNDMRVLMSIWKILMEKELQKRQEDKKE